ncbi:MAG: M48 family metalloprotease [Blastocatellia bacterium]|nr:M48 family metalloprotease [Blastocatellia bacterium]MBL8194916.1 M48 family metalloprotease [Blastocatellia bacterium]MBN8724575.1 M48 family metalloprotease [Acidobacteriota bacterium]
MRKLQKAISVIILVTLLLSSSLLAQTKIVAPKNPYKISDDVKLGQEAASEAERKLPIIRDRQLESYLVNVGQRLVEAIPPQYQQNEFRYSFKLVDAKEINAFALPGGFTYVNRGLIEVAKTEGELAGVMAHEISHVALRHGTAQAAKAQKYAIGATAGQILGAIVGGGLGSVIAGGSQLGIGAYFLKFSREYETQSDLLGAQIMAQAGYDPRDLGNMFRTIEKASGGKGGPEWLSSHPNPGNRYEAINREAELLNVRKSNRSDQEFSRVQARLRELPNATPRDNKNDNAGNNTGNNTGNNRPTSGGTINSRVALPSTRYKSYSDRSFEFKVPENWRELKDQNSVTFAPEGAYGEVSQRFIFTHGVLAGITRTNGEVNFKQASSEFIQALQQNNPNLRQQGQLQRTTVNGRRGFIANFTNVSDVTGKTESVTIITARLNNGDMFYLIPVSPQAESRNYQRAFQQIISSIQLSD